MFGGKVVVFGGDFRQILSVIRNGSINDIVNAYLSSSYIWPQCKFLKLTKKNLRKTVGVDIINNEQTTMFSNWLHELVESNVGEVNDGEIHCGNLKRSSNY